MSEESKTVDLEKVVIKFAGDSGDGMQLTGSQFTDTSAFLGNDLATFPDYPAEIRAPQGTACRGIRLSNSYWKSRYKYSWRYCRCISCYESCCP